LKVPILAIILALGVEAVGEDDVAVPFTTAATAAVLMMLFEGIETVVPAGEDDMLVPFPNITLDTKLVVVTKLLEATGLVDPVR
jgi:hypothetical protein